MTDKKTMSCFPQASAFLFELWNPRGLLVWVVHQERKRKQRLVVMLLGRGSDLTFHWHRITGWLLHISACAALIVECDRTKIVHYIDCLGLHYHHIALWSKIRPQYLWDIRTAFNWMQARSWRLRSLSYLCCISRERERCFIARLIVWLPRRSCSNSQRTAPDCICLCNRHFVHVWSMIFAFKSDA